ncbi:hypothetical protein KP509_34G001500 [Ceratopteris richardii]|uniref:Uncharacterized protein n=1 Tax=Ceratopteris richardii TaxID=49495 RepID=A0A8T2QIH2_CERRI|nr:hypothetical protein KP509_34G001500 [Ceratopteris richardii]
MAAHIFASTSSLVSFVSCRELHTREVLIPLCLSFRSPVSRSQTPLAMSIRRRNFVNGSLTSILLSLCGIPAHAADSEYEDWYRFEGQGFAVSIPPDFEDIRDPDEDYVDGPLYGNKAKQKTFAARFASPDRSEVMSVVVRESAQLKLSFLAVKDVTDLGSLKEAAKIFVPGGAKLYAARVVKVPDEISNRGQLHCTGSWCFWWPGLCFGSDSTKEKMER